MSEDIQKSRQQKQAYICQNVDPSLYEDFHDFCSSYAGQINIDDWTISYVYQLVAKFKEFLIQKSKEQDKHEKSFAIYQTTTGNNQISGSTSQLQINSVLESFDQPSRQEPSPNFTKKSNNQKSEQKVNTAATKKSVEPVQRNKKSVQKPKPVQTIKTEKQPKQINNNSFFDSLNFWSVPKASEPIQKKNYQTPKFIQSPKKEQTRKSNVNPSPNQFTTNANNQKGTSTNMKKPQQPVRPKAAQEKKDVKKTEPQINVQDFNNFFTMNSAVNPSKNMNTMNTMNTQSASTIKPSSSPVNFKNQFDTFSMIADEQLKKKRTTTITLDLLSLQSEETRKKSSTSSTIKLKEVKELKTGNSPQYSKQPMKGPKMFQNQLTDQVFCVKTAKRPLLDKQNLRVELKSHQIIQRSILSSNYIMYNMNVLPNNIICKRNYQDFTKLKTTLEKFYPGAQMPYLEKQGWRSDTTGQYAKKQGQMLQFFMSDLLRNPQIRNSRVIEQFLTLQDHKKMKRKFQQYAKMSKLKSIEQLCLLEGKVEVSLTQNQRIYNQNMGKFIFKLQNNIQKYRRYCENLSALHNQAMSTMLIIDDVLKQIQKDIQDFNRSVYIKQIQKLDKSIKKIRDNYKQTYFRTKFQKTIIDDSILPFLRYEKQNTHISKQIIDVSNSLTQKYVKRLQNEKNQGSDSSYLSSAYNEYKQGILEESKSMVVFKYQVGFILAQASSESKRILQNLGLKIDVLWKQIGNKYIDQFARSVNVYSSII